MLTARRDGFTLVEVVVALVILSTAVLGLGASTSRLATAAATAELRTLALESAEDVLAQVRLDPRYAALDTAYAGTDSDVFGIPGMTRTTTVDHVLETNPDVDYKKVSVIVSGPLLTAPVSRQLIIGAP
jgi:prepilin-type N-terminal cleavage/methylation domain-containing protein